MRSKFNQKIVSKSEHHLQRDLVNFSYSGLDFVGVSEGGIRTSVALPSRNLFFDVGNLPLDFLHLENLFVTHGHLDHANGIPYFISQRSLKNLQKPKIYLPEKIHGLTDEILKLYQKIEEFTYNYELIGAENYKLVSFDKNMYFKAIPTHHRIPSVGYTIFDKVFKLKPEFAHLNSQEIISLKKIGQIVTEEKLSPIVSFSGDTKIEYVLENEDVQKSKILFLECTYLDDKRNIERARQWGHLHLDEIVQNYKAFQNERLVLIHFSKRYKYKEIKEYVYSKLPKELGERTVCFI